jgi:hypothetical protein
MPITAALSTSLCPSGLVGGMVIFSNGVRRTIDPNPPRPRVSLLSSQKLRQLGDVRPDPPRPIFAAEGRLAAYGLLICETKALRAFSPARRAANSLLYPDS